MGVTAEGRRVLLLWGRGRARRHLVTRFTEKEGRRRGQEPEEDKVPSPADSQRETKRPD